MEIYEIFKRTFIIKKKNSPEIAVLKLNQIEIEASMVTII